MNRNRHPFQDVGDPLNDRDDLKVETIMSNYSADQIIACRRVALCFAEESIELRDTSSIASAAFE